MYKQWKKIEEGKNKNKKDKPFNKSNNNNNKKTYLHPASFYKYVKCTSLYTKSTFDKSGNVITGTLRLMYGTEEKKKVN